jgi:putative ABC transport system ATP-binding protein
MDGLAALEARDLYRFFHAAADETLALRGVSLTVMPGELVAVIGPSGSGKSTLLHCLAGLDEPDGGAVFVGGEQISRRSEADRAGVRARRIGVLLQTGNLIDHLTVMENLELAAALAGRRAGSRATASLDALGVGHCAKSLPARLSGGELARVSLALALINEPDILLADEPTGEIDSVNEDCVLAILTERAAAGGATLVVTHSEAVAHAAHRVIRLTDGRVVND